MNPIPHQVPEKFAFDHFKDNKYTRWYFSIVSKPFTGDGYSENHHIIPKAMGGPNSKSNIVRLTARQHFVIHRLLIKMTEGIFKKKAMAAFRAVALMKSPQAQSAGGQLCFVSSSMYEMLRIAHAENTSRRMKKLWASPEFRAKMSTSQPKELRSQRAKKSRTPEVIEAHRLKITGIKKTEEAKAKMSKARSKRLAEDPEYKAKAVAGLAKGLEVARARKAAP
jgi:hypothetical protein